MTEADSGEEYCVATILGKRCKDHLTREGVGRVEKFLELYNAGALKPKIVVPTGGIRPGTGTNYPEAALIHAFLIGRGFPKDLIGIEPKAQDTIKNIDLLLAKLEETRIPLPKVKLVIVTTDYHVERMRMVRMLMPEVDMLLGKLERTVGKHEFFPAPYCYRGDDDPIKRWQAKLYEGTDRLRIFETNIEALSKARCDMVYSDVSKMYPEYLRDIEKVLVTKRPESGNRQMAQRLDQIQRRTYFMVEDLREYYQGHLARLVGNQNPADMTVHAATLKKTHDIINEFLDPDEPYVEETY